MFSCEFCEIAKNIFSFRTLPVAASVMTFVFKAGETLPIKMKMILLLTRVFLITNSLKGVHLLSEIRLPITMGLSFCL